MVAAKLSAPVESMRKLPDAHNFFLRDILI